MRAGDRIVGTMALLAALAGCAGCAHSVPAPRAAAAEPAIDPATALKHFRNRRFAREIAGEDLLHKYRHEQGPVLHHTYAIDYAALAVEGELRPVGPGLRLPALHVEDANPSFRAVASGNWLMQLEVAAHRAHVEPASLPPFARSGFSFGDFGVVRPLARAELRSVPSQTAAPCDATMRTSWQGFSTDGWLEGGLDYVRVEARIEASGCRVIPRRVVTVRAGALIPGVLYAFRRCGLGCDARDPDRQEQLVLIAPPARWVGASVEPGDLPRSSSAGNRSGTGGNTGTFSVSAIPVRRGAAGSVFLNIDAVELSRFLQWRGDLPPAWESDSRIAGDEQVQLGVDVIWSSADDLPTATGTTSLVTPLAAPLLRFNARSD